MGQIISSQPLPGSGGVQSSTPLSDDDIIKSYGYNPDDIKKSTGYHPGDIVKIANRSALGASNLVGTLGSYVGGVVEGVGDVASGASQLVNRGLHWVSNDLVSDSDLKLNELQEKIQRDAYLHAVNNDPSKLSELVGQAAIPLPGGAADSILGAIAKGAGTGVVSAALQPVTDTSKESYASQKAKQMGVGAVTGAVTGGIVHGTGNLISKASNAPSSILPEETAAQLQTQADTDATTAKQAADIAAGRILQEKTAAKQASDEAAGKVLQAKQAADLAKQQGATGVPIATQNANQAALDLANKRADLISASKTAQDAADNAAQAQATGVGNTASLASTNLRNTLGSTPFHGTDELVAAAQGGDGSAGRVLKQIQDAGDNPDRIQQASIQLRNWQTRQVASQKYNTVAEIANKVAPGDVPVTQTAAEVVSALRDASNAKIPDKSLINTLETVRDNLGAGRNPSPVDNTYQSLRQFDDDLGGLIRSGQKGTNALVSDTQVPVLTNIRKALRTDLDSFTQSNPELKAAADDADNYYKTERVPFKQPDISNAATTVDPDQIYDGLIKSGGGDKAQRYYNALDPKGRAAVRYQMATDAVNAATDPVRGTFDPEKFYNALDRVQEAHQVFFSGSEADEMNGLKNLAKQAVATQDAAKGVGAKVMSQGSTAVRDAQQKLLQSRIAVQMARMSRDTTANLAEKDLADTTARAQAASEDFARDSNARQLQAQAQAEDAARIAQGSKETADSYQKGVDEAAKQRNRFPLGTVAAGAGLAADTAARLGMPYAAYAAGGLSAAAATTKFLTQTDAGRRFLIANSTRTPVQAAIENVISKQIPALATRVATSPSQSPSPASLQQLMQNFNGSRQ